MSSSNSRMVGVLLLAVSVIAGAAQAGVPRIMSFQGKLTDSDGHYLQGDQDLTFRIYDRDTGGVVLWSEQHVDTPVTRGVFAVPLGVNEPLDLPFDTNYWISIEVETDGEMSPRQQLTSAPYAFRASASDRAAAADTATFAHTAGAVSGIDMSGLFVECNETSPASKVDVVARSLSVAGVVATNLTVTVDITQTGANGLDTGSPEPNTWYYLWIVCGEDTSNLAGLLSASPDTPTLPLGYTRKRFVASLRTGPSSSIVRFYQSGATVLYDELISVASSGGNNWTDLDLSQVVPPGVRLVTLTTLHQGGVSPASSLVLFVRPDGSTSERQYYSQLYSGYQTTSGVAVTGKNRVIEYKITNNGAGGDVVIYVGGFILNL